MRTKETINEFYKRHLQGDRNTGQFNVYRREEFACDSTSLPPNRRDFYKISLIVEGEGLMSASNTSLYLRGPALTFMNPIIPYSWEPTTNIQTGYFCLFTEDFIDTNLKNHSLSASPLFKVGGDHIFFLAQDSANLLSTIFESMIREMASPYQNKYDLLRSYIQIVMHEAMKMQSPGSFFQTVNASERLVSFFIELLERQFPIDSPNQTLKFRTAKEFAAQLNVHPNHLNRALKEVTGKTTSEWIAGRIAKEAKALLQHSNWDISQVSYCLGFEHSSNFHLFFKKLTGESPGYFRKTHVAISYQSV
jgi:AraC family transcriptional regulator, transcriptional activator of pobA